MEKDIHDIVRRDYANIALEKKENSIVNDRKENQVVSATVGYTPIHRKNWRWHRKGLIWGWGVVIHIEKQQFSQERLCWIWDLEQGLTVLLRERQLEEEDVPLVWT